MRDVLYIMDEIDYCGGAHIATKRLIKALAARGDRVDVLVHKEPTCQERDEMMPAEIISYNLKVTGWRRIVHRILRFGGMTVFPHWIYDFGSRIRNCMNQYHCVCVMSESSPFRFMVSMLPKYIRKVQMVHIDYVFWSEMGAEQRRKTRSDSFFFRRMDAIAIVGEVNACKFRDRYPYLSEKTFGFWNVIPTPNRISQKIGLKEVELVSVIRVEQKQKDAPRLLRIARELHMRGLKFHWNVFGEGPLLHTLQRDVKILENDGFIVFRGRTNRPLHEISQADILILLSHYEGLPNVVFESLMVGTPVFSTNVGAVSEQISESKTGWLVDNNYRKICDKLEFILRNRYVIENVKKNLVGYSYDNHVVVERHREILGLKRGKLA